MPSPKKVRLGASRFQFRANTPILIQRANDDDFRAAKVLQQGLEERTGFQHPIESHSRTKGLKSRIELSRESSDGQSYRLLVKNNACKLVGKGSAGLRYAIETLLQLVMKQQRSITTLSIEDEPELDRRGILIDISRGKVPTVETIKTLIDLMVRLKMNLLMLYTEHTFSFRQHPQISKGSSPMTSQDLLELDTYASERHVELVPTLQSLGHLHHLLSIPKYRHLAESDKLWSISPAISQSYDLLYDLYSEFLPNFRSEWFNANCDEPVDLGTGRSSQWSKREGRGAVFRSHIEKITSLVRQFDKKPMFWSDVVHEHPEQIPLLSRELMLLDWWYEADHHFDRVRVLANNKIPFMVCGGTGSWNALFPRGENAIKNIRGHAEAGKKFGAKGLITTDWGDNGHYNLLGNSFFGFSWAAQAGWGSTTLSEKDFDRAFALHIFGDKSGATSKVYRQMGALHETGFEHFNNSPLKSIYFDDVIKAKYISQVDQSKLENTLNRLLKVKKFFYENTQAFHTDRTAREELKFAINASVLAAKKGLLANHPQTMAKEQTALKALHKRLWNIRNKPSGFHITETLYETSIKSMNTLAKRKGYRKRKSNA